MTTATLVAMKQICRNCGSQFIPDEVSNCILCDSSICPSCKDCNCGEDVKEVSGYTFVNQQGFLSDAVLRELIKFAFYAVIGAAITIGIQMLAG
ncbi:hypothetical protein LCGC14_1440470 [marine sediment metagenome]|uniref:Uncharacterized protein n=1 Tax=marine sediment metagenome TaxID=412755 RepID=A0A0F9M1F4_9ZZZZ